MSNRALAVIALVALAICAFIYFEKDRPGTATRQERERYLLNLKADEVDRVELTNPSGTYIFARTTDGGWTMESPVAYPADDSNVGTLLSDLEFAQRQGVIRREGDEDFPQLLPRFGLSEPRILIRISRAKKVQSVAIGSETARKGNFYALVDEGTPKEIVVVDSMLEGQLNQGPDFWRSRALIEFSPAEVQSVIAREGGRESEMKRTENTWQVVRPLDLTADTARATRYLNEIRQLRAERFVAEAGADLSPFGFSPPSGSLEISTPQGNQTILFGGPVPEDRSLIYAQPAGHGNVVAVSAQATGFLNLLSKVRPRNVLTWPLDQTPLSLEITVGKESFLLSRTEGPAGFWSVAQGDWQAKADPTLMNNFLSSLRGLEALEFLESKDNPNTTYGLSNPTATLVIKFPESAKLPENQTLRFGATRQGETYLESSEIPFIITVTQSFIDTLPKHPWNLLSKEIEVFPSGDITKVRWEGGGPEMTVKKDGEGKWSASGPKEPFDEVFFVQQTEMLGALQATEWIGPAGSKEFARPRLTLTVTAGDREKKLLFGARRPDGSVPVRVEGEPFAFTIAEDTFKALCLRPVTQPPAQQ
ncbi:MAG: hypothetical protein OHK005_08940 [Candidatus Methylacidiphilales bacterium]